MVGLELRCELTDEIGTGLNHRGIRDAGDARRRLGDPLAEHDLMRCRANHTGIEFLTLQRQGGEHR